MASSQNPTGTPTVNELRGLGKDYQGAAIRWRDFPSTDTTTGAAYQDIIMACGFRLFIMGVEVTPHVMGSISWDRHGRDGSNSLNFTLDNNNSKFVYTNTDLGGSSKFDTAYIGDTLTSTSDIPLNNMVPKLDAKISSKSNESDIPDADNLTWYIPAADVKDKFVFDEVPKKYFYKYKSKLGIKTPATGNDYKARYDLTPGACAINLMDHVRLFIMDPNEDTVLLSDTKWKPEFTGFVTSANVTNNPLTGESTLSITCNDIRHLMRKMRYITNLNDISILSSLISFTDSDEVQDGAGVFNDLLIASSDPKWSNTLAESSADSVIRAITVGDDLAALAATTGQPNRVADQEKTQDALYPKFTDAVDQDTLETQYTRKIDAVQAIKSSSTGQRFSPIGTYTLGLYKGYDPPADGADNSSQISKLEEWMDILNFGIARQWLDYDTVTLIGQNTKPSLGVDRGATDDQSAFSALNGFVHILCPAGGLSVSNVWDRVFVTFDGSPTMSNRMEVLEQMCNTIDYQIQVNAMGDLCFEFPMYDFYPEEFGKYKYTMALSDSIKHYDFNDEGDGNPITGLRVFGQYKAEDQYNEDDSWLQHNLYSIYIKSDYMASKYGVLVEELGIPWAMNAWGNTDAENKEKLGALASFGIIEFMKRMSKMSSMSLNSTYNPFLWPNKPIINRDARRMGLMNSVNNSMQINGLCTTGIGCEYIRKADTDGTFLNLCGAQNTPFSYANRGGLSLFPNKTAVAGDKELPFLQNNSLIYTFNNGFGIEIIQPDETMIYSLFAKYGINGTPVSHQGAMGKKTYSDPQKCYNAFRRLPQNQQDALEAVANKLCHGRGTLRGWQIYQYMQSESGYQLTKTNSNGGAVGLIQYIPSTLVHLYGKGALEGAPSGMTSAQLQQWFRNSQYCTGPNAYVNQIALAGTYLALNSGGTVANMDQLNRTIYMPGAVKDTSVPFASSAQPASVRARASKTDGNSVSLDDLLYRVKGIDSNETTDNETLEKAYLAGKGSSAKTATAATTQVIKSGTNAAYTQGTTIADKAAKAVSSTASGVVNSVASWMLGNSVSKVGTAVSSSANATTGKLNNTAATAATQASQVVDVKGTVNDVTNSTLNQVGTNVSNTSVLGYKPLKGGGFATTPGLTAGTSGSNN